MRSDVPVSVSVLIASSGRMSLGRTLESVQPQLLPGDELIVDVNDDAPWGHRARNRMMPRARASHLLFIDDDDIYLSGALAVVREFVARDRDAVNIFRMRYADGRELWRRPEVRVGNVSTQMVVVPNDQTRLGMWSDRYEGDFDFIFESVQRFGVVFHPYVIVLVRPS